ncbi:MAG: hypothetical protein PUH84_02685 [Firmicutes bacterium]|nr:hypothetical protein [Bacillota bacterium]MDY5335166.1 hypothetical protein [Bacilli bacterium]
MDIKEELIRRYSYLYENKELILAMCINIVEDKPNERKQELEKIKRKYEKSPYDKTKTNKQIVDSLENVIKNMNESTYKYYLFKDVNPEIVELYEDFILGDLPLEETDLYRHIEAVKNNQVYLEAFNNIINALEYQRQKNMHLKKMPTFTVWKILSYVRRKHINNDTILKVLDKYYNLDRYMLTNYNYQSGYYITEEELNEDYTFPNPEVYTGNIIFKYIGNEYEEEDNYYIEKSLYRTFKENYATSAFVVLVKDAPMIDLDSKKELYQKYNYNKDKKIIKKKN